MSRQEPMRATATARGRASSMMIIAFIGLAVGCPADEPQPQPQGTPDEQCGCPDDWSRPRVPPPAAEAPQADVPAMNDAGVAPTGDAAQADDFTVVLPGGECDVTLEPLPPPLPNDQDIEAALATAGYTAVRPEWVNLMFE